MSPTTNQIVLMTRLSARDAKHKALYARGISARYMHDGMHGIDLDSTEVGTYR